MTKIIDRLSPWFPKIKKSDGEFGIEIETETKKAEDYPEDFLKVWVDDYGKKLIKTPKLKKWCGHFDNSLRNYGIEYIFSEPYSFVDSLAALDEFEKQTKGIKFLQHVPSTSVHVHWNVFNETFLTMANFLALYMLYENILVSYCGPLRRSNLFALPTRVAETTADNAVDLLQKLNRGDYRGVMIQDHHAKYGALNLSSLNRLGSLEVRSMRGTTDVSEIKEWLSIIHQMILYSRANAVTPQEVLDIYRDDSPELFSLTFGPYTKVLREAAETDPEHGFEYLVEKNLWYLKMIAEAVPDWSKFNSCMDKSYEAVSKAAEKKSKQYMNHVTQLGQPIGNLGAQVAAQIQPTAPEITVEIGFWDEESEPIDSDFF